MVAENRRTRRLFQITNVCRVKEQRKNHDFGITVFFFDFVITRMRREDFTLAIRRDRTRTFRIKGEKNFQTRIRKGKGKGLFKRWRVSLILIFIVENSRLLIITVLIIFLEGRLRRGGIFFRFIYSFVAYMWRVYLEFYVNVIF